MDYIITYGRKVNPAKYEVLEISLSQAFNDEEMPRDAAYNEVRSFVLGKIEAELAVYAERVIPAKPVEPASATPEKKPEIAGKALEYYYPDVEALEWRAFKEKRPARPDEAGWMFANTPGIDAVVDVIRKEGTIFVRMDGHRFLCKLSGKEEQFLNRSPQDENAVR